MKYLFTFLFLLTIAPGCKPKVLKGKALDNKLKETMTTYLRKTLNPDVTFEVKDVMYYPEVTEKNFICQFHVTMRKGNKDTTGIVAATITQDFQKVFRTQ
jgi:hypothetical protein